MGNSLSRPAKNKTASKFLALSRELRNNIYDKIPRDLQIEWLWDTQGYTDTSYATCDIVKVTLHNTTEPGILAACTRLREEMLEQDQLLNKTPSVSIAMMSRVSKMRSPSQVKMQQKEETTTRARNKTAFRNVQHAILCIRHLTSNPPRGLSSTTRLLRWSFLGMPKSQTFRLALAKSFTVQDEKLTRQILPRDPRNHRSTFIKTSPLLLLQRCCGFRVGFESLRAEEDD